MAQDFLDALVGTLAGLEALVDATTTTEGRPSKKAARQLAEAMADADLDFSDEEATALLATTRAWVALRLEWEPEGMSDAFETCIWVVADADAGELRVLSEWDYAPAEIARLARRTSLRVAEWTDDDRAAVTTALVEHVEAEGGLGAVDFTYKPAAGFEFLVQPVKAAQERVRAAAPQ